MGYLKNHLMNIVKQ